MFTRLLSLWVTGALLLPLNWGTTLGIEDYDEDVTPTPDYDYPLYDDKSFNYENYVILNDTKNQGNTV
ncbi:hypothetical protein cypCar_00021574 [Cyprinus carpio]|nr:hypothetical protein cypCar_00021574 [Cyprinus carpio]